MLSVQFSAHDTNKLWMAGAAKAEWFKKNNWPIHIQRMAKFEISEEQARTYNQFCGLAGEAALWQWLYGDLSGFWVQQSALHESQALTDGGIDMPGLDVKTRDLITDPIPWLIISPHKLDIKVRYVLCVVQSEHPSKPEQVSVDIIGSIHGEVVDRLKLHWWHEGLHRITIEQEFLTPPETLKW